MKWIVNATIVRSDRVMKGSLLIKEDQISATYEDPLPSDFITGEHEVIDAEGMLLLPGLIDIHCDAIEKEVQPRPNTFYPMELAMFDLEKKLAGSGITTMYQSVSLGVGLSLRGDHLLVKLIDQIKRHRSLRSMIRHKIHLRYELIHLAGLELARELLKDGTVDYLSFMNHSPGQGQYRKPGSFEAYVMKNQGVNKEEVQKIVDNAVRMQDEIDWDGIKGLADTARRLGIPMASHDDDTVEKVDDFLRYGMAVSEFPLNMKTAEYAAEQQLHVCVGAPNVVRGGSHDENLTAMDAIRAGYATILCSDYLPSSLLTSVFTVANQGAMSLPHAVNMASLHPANAMGIDDAFGSIEDGKVADLLLVKVIDGYPFVTKTFVNGTCVYSADFYR
jgi:alpha-D-ribose 1-methylphosphonate 5-triphosphate diphosphatase